MTVMTFTDRKIEELADNVKVEVVKALVAEGLIDIAVAEQWTAEHTVRTRDKTLWRTISERWKNEPAAKDAFYCVVVKTI